MFMGDDDIVLDVLKNIIEDHILIAFLIFKILSKNNFFFWSGLIILKIHVLDDASLILSIQCSLKQVATKFYEIWL